MRSIEGAGCSTAEGEPLWNPLKWASETIGLSAS